MLREHYHLAFLSMPDTRTSRAVFHTVLDHHYIMWQLLSVPEAWFLIRTEWIFLYNSTIRSQKTFGLNLVKFLKKERALDETSKDFEVIIYGSAHLRGHSRDPLQTLDWSALWVWTFIQKIHLINNLSSYTKLIQFNQKGSIGISWIWSAIISSYHIFWTFPKLFQCFISCSSAHKMAGSFRAV